MLVSAPDELGSGMNALLDRRAAPWAVLLPLCCAACAARGEAEVDSTRQSLLGGRAVEDGAWPNVVALDSGCTATLLAPDLLITAGHCTPAARVLLGEEVPLALDGATLRPGDEAEPSGGTIEVERCVVHPAAEVGGGRDLGFCVLEEALPDVPVTGIAVGCARDQLRPPVDVSLVGYGLHEPGGSLAGDKQMVEARLQAEGRELVIGDGLAGTCRGDSGGPAFARVEEPDGGSSWQLLAVLSSGMTGQCGVGYYTDLSRHVEWLELESGRDLTPCSDAFGRWQPGPDCRAAALDAEGRPRSQPGRPLATCGEPFEDRGPEPAGCAVRAGERARTAVASIAIALLAVLVARRIRRLEGS